MPGGTGTGVSGSVGGDMGYIRSQRTPTPEVIVYRPELERTIRLRRYAGTTTSRQTSDEIEIQQNTRYRHGYGFTLFRRHPILRNAPIPSHPILRKETTEHYYKTAKKTSARPSIHPEHTSIHPERHTNHPQHPT